MNLLVSCMGYDGGKSGISAYMRNVVKNLGGKGHEITLVVEPDAVKDFEGFKQIVAPKIFSKSALGMLWHTFILPFYGNLGDYDCLLILAANRRYALNSSIPRIGVVHDLSQYRVSGKYDFFRMLYLKHIQPFLGRRIESLAAISLSTKADIEKFWRVDPSKITLNYNGLVKIKDRDDSVLTRLKLTKYIYYVSRIEHPGKNHLNLIKAFEALPKELKDEYKLVFTGSSWSGAEIVKSYAENSKDKDRIVFTGYVTDGELGSLYEHASAFAFPSFSEGFGLPLIEAMSLRVPCVCSNDSALAEIGADAALTFNPHSITEIKDALEKVLTDRDLRAVLAERGVRRAAVFDWNLHADILIEMCKKEYVKNSKLRIFDINFDNARMPEIVSNFDATIQSGQKKSVGFINTHYLNTAYENRAQIARYNTFDYVLPDGSGVSIACKIMGYRYRDNLNGTDLLPKICELAQERGYTLYFFGGKESVSAKAAENLLNAYPALKIVKARSGYFTKEGEAAIIAEINALKPNFLFVGFGAILQEKWVSENLDKLDASIVFAIGGVADVYSGNLFRVNPKLREWGLEWLGRLYQEPVRLFGRYVIGNPLFVLRVIKYRLFKKL